MSNFFKRFISSLLKIRIKDQHLTHIGFFLGEGNPLNVFLSKSCRLPQIQLPRIRFQLCKVQRLGRSQAYQLTG